jgi:hypothetical protein
MKNTTLLMIGILTAVAMLSTGLVVVPTIVQSKCIGHKFRVQTKTVE